MWCLDFKKFVRIDHLIFCFSFIIKIDASSTILVQLEDEGVIYFHHWRSDKKQYSILR